MTDLEKAYQHGYNHQAVYNSVRAAVYHNCDSSVVFLCCQSRMVLHLKDKESFASSDSMQKRNLNFPAIVS